MLHKVLIKSIRDSLKKTHKNYKQIDSENHLMRKIKFNKNQFNSMEFNETCFSQLKYKAKQPLIGAK